MPALVPIKKALDTNSTQTTFAGRTVATSAPGGDGVLDLASPALGWGNSLAVPSLLKLVPFGGTTNNNSFDFRVWGWNKVAGTEQYVPQLIVQVTATMGTIPAGALGTSQYLCDTLAVVAGTSNVVTLSSPGGDLPGYAVINVRSCQWIDFADFDMTGALNANHLVAPVETP